MDPVVIVGAGMAGYAVAHALRQRNASMPLQLITRDAGAVYAKPALSNGFAHGRDARQMISASGSQAGAGLGIDVRMHAQVHSIDVDARVMAYDGGHIAYSSMVLATGAVPVPLAVAGSGRADVLSINHLDVYSVLRDRLATAGPGARVVVIGADAGPAPGTAG